VFLDLPIGVHVCEFRIGTVIYVKTKALTVHLVEIEPMFETSGVAGIRISGTGLSFQHTCTSSWKVVHVEEF
jgi:hypothetical protein